MRAEALRDVLLVKAIEETDASGAVLPIADREAATRSAARALPAPPRLDGAALAPDVQALLAARAATLAQRIVAQRPVVGHVLRISDRLAGPGLALLVVAAVAGWGVVQFDPSRRIEILVSPVAGLVAWNLLVYAVLLLRLRHRAAGGRGTLVRLAQRLADARLQGWLRRSGFFDAAVAVALRRFASDWGAVARPLVALRAERLLHLGAIAVAAGLLVALYGFGFGRQYEAGWESTWLGAPQMHALLRAVYGPASLLTGIALPPDAGAVQALRWQPGRPGAAPQAWVHLMAATAAIYIVVPRLLLAALATWRVQRLARRAPLPPSLAPYARTLLGGVPGARLEGAVAVVPYAHEPSPAARAGLAVLLDAALGPGHALQVQDPVRYGDEAAAATRLDAAPAAGCCVLLLNFAATPEAENHGAFVAALRDAAGRSAAHPVLLLLVDESAYAARMQGDASFAARLEERRKLWRSFAGVHGLAACTSDLAALATRAPAPAEVDAIRGALSPGGT